MTSYRNTFTYDPTGNRTVLDNLLDGRTTSTYDAANRLITADAFSGITTFSYDAAGNRTQVEEPTGDITTNTWDAQNHLVQVELPTGDVVTYTWAPVNKSAEERIVERDDGITLTRYLWDNNNVLRETDDVGAVEATYTYRPQPFGDLVAQHRDGDSTFYQFDALGSTTGLTDATGAVTDEFRYEAFGKTAGSTGSTETPYQWVGQLGYRHDDSTRDYNLRNRQYDPQTGQFLSVDPLGLASSDSNFYRYVANNPINLVDPDGLESKPKSMKAQPKPPITVAPAQQSKPEQAIAEKLGPQVDLNKIPASRIEQLLSEPAIKKVLGPGSMQQPKPIKKNGKTVVVTPFDLDGKIVQAVFVDNTPSVMKSTVSLCLEDYSIQLPQPAPSTYRFVGVGPSQISPEALADLKVFDQEELETAQGNAQVLTAVLHTIPFGTAVDAAVCGKDSGVSTAELVLVTVADAALVTGLVLKATTAGGKAVFSGVAATRIARGAVIANTIADIGQAGMAAATAVNDPTAGNIAVAAGIATAIIFGASWKLADDAVPNNPKPKPTPETVVPPPKPEPPATPSTVAPINNTGATVRVYRVEGTPNTRVLVGENGEIAIVDPNKTLYLNFGDKARAEQYLAQKLSPQQKLGPLPGAEVKSFEVPKSFVDELRASAVTEAELAANPALKGRPLVSDPTKTPDSFGLRPEQIECLKKQIIPGSGRTGLE